jgi:hypothetical protein
MVCVLLKTIALSIGAKKGKWIKMAKHNYIYGSKTNKFDNELPDKQAKKHKKPEIADQTVLQAVCLCGCRGA